jgi:hypothetical protein
MMHDDAAGVDVDSFIGEVHGCRKQGIGFGYTKRGYHPLLAFRADTGEVRACGCAKAPRPAREAVVCFA